MRWFTWLKGRQNSGYEKMVLFANQHIIPCDIHLLRYFVGSLVPVHYDLEPGYRHYRLNIIIRKAIVGGEFWCQHPIISFWRIHFFRSDDAHSVSKIQKGSRYVLSFGLQIKKLVRNYNTQK